MVYKAGALRERVCRGTCRDELVFGTVRDQGDAKQVIVAGSLQLAGYDLQTGKKQWWVNSLSRIVDPTRPQSIL